jgi:hypothetical protein
VVLIGTDQRITSGPAANAAASRWRQSSRRKQAGYMAAPERFAEKSDSSCTAGAVHYMTPPRFCSKWLRYLQNWAFLVESINRSVSNRWTPICTQYRGHSPTGSRPRSLPIRGSPSIRPSLPSKSNGRPISVSAFCHSGNAMSTRTSPTTTCRGRSACDCQAERWHGRSKGRRTSSSRATDRDHCFGFAGIYALWRVPGLRGRRNPTLPELVCRQSDRYRLG